MKPETLVRDTEIRAEQAADRGSVLPVALFVLALLTAIGLALLAVTSTDQGVADAGNRVRESFYGSEAALEHGREDLRQWNIASGSLTLDEELTRAAGPNGIIDVDPVALDKISDVLDAIDRARSGRGRGSRN